MLIYLRYTGWGPFHMEDNRGALGLIWLARFALVAHPARTATTYHHVEKEKPCPLGEHIPAVGKIQCARPFYVQSTHDRY